MARINNMATVIAAEFANAMQNFQWQIPQSCDIRNFYGLPSECVRDFIESIELWQVSSGMSNESTARRVPRFLKGVAQDWYTLTMQKMPEISNNWELLKNELLKSFSLDEFNYKMNIEYKLRNRIQLENEPFRNYYIDVMKLCNRINPNMSDEERKSKILNGLRADLYQQIAASIPNTCEEFFQKIQSIESVNCIVAERNKRNGHNGYQNFNFPIESHAYFANVSKNQTETKSSANLHEFALLFADSVAKTYDRQKTDRKINNERQYNKRLKNDHKYGKGSQTYFKNKYKKFQNRNKFEDQFCVFCRELGHRIRCCEKFKDFSKKPKIAQKAITSTANNPEITCGEKVTVFNVFPEKSNFSSALFLPVKINCFPTIAVVDTGAGLSVISKKFYDLLSVPRKNKSPLKIRSVNNEICSSLGEVEFRVKLGRRSIKVNAQILENFPYHLLIGNDIISREKLIIDFSDPENLKIKFSDSKDVIQAFLSQPKTVEFKTEDHIKIEPNSVCLVKVIAKQNYRGIANNFIAKINKKYEPHLFMPKTILSNKNELFVPIANLTENKMILKKGKTIAFGKEITSINLTETTKESEKDYVEISENEFNIGDDLTETERTDLIKLLLKYKHCFAKTLSEVTPTNIIEVNIDTEEPLRKILNELLTAKIIRPSSSSFCAPLLLVQKKGGEFRLVIDFRDLNAKILNENCYPLPRIEDIIDSIRESVKKVTFLGHVISEKGIEIGEDRINAIMNIDQPKNVTEIKSFLGVLFYFKDIKNLQIISEPLIKLTRKNEPFIFSDQQIAAFDELKMLLCTAPILSYFNPELKTQLHTDGSNVGIGAALIQLEGETEKIICYYSRVLNSAEKHYSAVEIELLAIVQGIKRFKHYLTGCKFEVVTDSNPLTYLMRTKNLNSRLSRWSMFLQEYNFDIVYRKGSSNKLCDFLSRYPQNTGDNQSIEIFLSDLEHTRDYKEFNKRSNILVELFLTQLNDIEKLQREDKYLSHIFEILSGKVDGKNKSLRKAASNYEFVNGKLYRVIAIDNELKNVLAIPRCLIPQVLQGVHDCIFSGGHLGIRKTFERVKIRFHWKSMFKDIVNWVQSCPTCQKVKPNIKRSGKLCPISTGSRPFSKIGIDIIGMLPSTKKGNRFIIVAICYLTKFAITQALKNVTAKDVAQFLMNKIVLQYSAFDTLISDNGVQFRNNVISELNKLLKSSHKFTTPYQPSTAGQVERCNQQIMQLIRTYIEKDKNDWDEILPYITHLYNVSFHSSTKFTPFYLTRGYHPKLPIDFIVETDKTFNISPENYSYEISQNLLKARELAKQNILNSQAKNKQLYDKDKQNYEFNEGDKCLVNYPISNVLHKNKLMPKWLGPFTIIRKLNNLVYEIESDDGNYYFDRIHISKMRPFKERKLMHEENTKAGEIKNDEKIKNETIRSSNRKRVIPKYLLDYYLGNCDVLSHLKSDDLSRKIENDDLSRKMNYFDFCQGKQRFELQQVVFDDLSRRLPNCNLKKGSAGLWS
ncbi:pol polyprotein-like protein [Dinothrombium tinctorium]|uniref:RNA-directed DNA polymerase n=1 Tax=Dinothrombium tinctorium TaxID=1965070 RepID=A0A3S3QMV1_9ACAR|nr:pol polyprotein-like protein [Dinothrombium tinctorium]RWS11273.1 pol polyprotein-like protein [Dinothrombium tinctorium]